MTKANSEDEMERDFWNRSVEGKLFDGPLDPKKELANLRSTLNATIPVEENNEA